jgi:Sortase domain
VGRATAAQRIRIARIGLSATVVLGHLDADSGPAVFWSLARLRPWDDVVVDRADGGSARFRVDRIARFARASFPSGEVYGATASPELRLITCGGAFDWLAGEYGDNVVVFATLV